MGTAGGIAVPAGSGDGSVRLEVATLPALIELCGDIRPDVAHQFEAMYGRKWSAAGVALDIDGRYGEKFMLLDGEGRPVCAAGWEPLRPGVFDGWMVSSMADWQVHGKSITKYCRRIMEHMLSTGAHRLQIHCLKSRTQAANWYVRGLKMQHNGDLPCYGVNGEDAAVYARVGAMK